MAIKVKSVSEASAKLVRNAQAGSGDLVKNASAAAETWASNTQAAKGNFQQAVTAGNMAEKFARGVAKAGAAKFRSMMEGKAAARFSTGLNLGKTFYESNTEPYFSTIAALDLGPREPRGSAANYQRVQKVGQALNAKRLALLGVSG